jgi:L-asparaginase
MRANKLMEQSSLFTKQKNTQFKPASLALAPLAKSAPSSIYIVATGGTIAGTSHSATATNYSAGNLLAEQLTSAIPELKNFNEDICSINLFHIDSSDITLDHWLTLARTVNNLLIRDDIKGVVITHGTDTLEETAYFLDLVIKSDKPVVLVGAMRPATSISADGPLNLYNAVAVIHSPAARNRGVMVLMNDTIFDGRDVTKCNTSQVNTFNAPNSGPIGHISYGDVTFEKIVVRKNTINTTFDVSQINKLPNIQIIYECAGSDGSLLKAAIKLKPDGIVIAGTGNGNVTAADKALLKYARDRGIHIIRSSRTGSGRVSENNVDNLDNEIGLIAGDNLNPQKARILLMLSLTQTQAVCEIRRNFATY